MDHTCGIFFRNPGSYIEENFYGSLEHQVNDESKAGYVLVGMIDLNIGYIEVHSIRNLPIQFITKAESVVIVKALSRIS